MWWIDSIKICHKLRKNKNWMKFLEKRFLLWDTCDSSNSSSSRQQQQDPMSFSDCAWTDTDLGRIDFFLSVFVTSVSLWTFLFYLLFHSSCLLFHSFFLLLFLSFYVLFKYFNLLIFPSFYVLFHSLFTSLNVTLISQNCNMCTSVQMRE